MPHLLQIVRRRGPPHRRLPPPRPSIPHWDHGRIGRGADADLWVALRADRPHEPTDGDQVPRAHHQRDRCAAEQAMAGERGGLGANPYDEDALWNVLLRKAVRARVAADPRTPPEGSKVMLQEARARLIRLAPGEAYTELVATRGSEDAPAFLMDIRPTEQRERETRGAMLSTGTCEEGGWSCTDRRGQFGSRRVAADGTVKPNRHGEAGLPYDA